MTEINFNKNIYLYGKYYDFNRVKIPKDEQNWSIIIYVNPIKEKDRIVGSLEGYFVSEQSLKEYEFIGTLLCNRDKMEEFEKQLKGKFFPFEK
jgi:hypothetical protein